MQIENVYTFYDWPDEKCKEYIGKVLQEKNYIYFPVGLSNKWENYGKETGLVYVSPLQVVKGKGYFSVGAFSPDDLDMGVFFKENEKKCELARKHIIKFMRRNEFRDVLYREIFERIHETFGGTKDGF